MPCRAFALFAHYVDIAVPCGVERLFGFAGAGFRLLCGSGLLLISLVLGFIFGDVSFGGIAGKALVCWIVGAVGGVLGVN